MKLSRISALAAVEYSWLAISIAIGAARYAASRVRRVEDARGLPSRLPALIATVMMGRVRTGEGAP